MNLLVRLIQVLVLVLGGLGVWGLFVDRRPTSWSTAVDAFGDFLPAALDHPAIPWLMAGWVIGIGLRILPGLPSARGERSRMDATADPRPAPIESSMAEAPQPTARRGDRTRGRRDRDRRRIRLEAFLRAQPDVPAFVQQLLTEAVRSGASDLHLRPGDGVTVCDLRIRGEMGELVSYPGRFHDDVVRRIKVLSDLVPYVTDRPQDGRMAFEVADGGGRSLEVWIRVAIVPSSRGEKITLRLAGDASARPFDALGLIDSDRRRFEALLDQTQGMIVLTGPTGCGKTTTLYSALAHLKETPGRRALASIEDPVEVDLPFVQQTAVDRERGLGFAEALRAILRQDPDVLMVGEIRDAETARIAVQASLSGHLLLTTLHADTAIGVFPRLIDLGVEPFLVGSATLGCIGQRLLPRLCPECRHPRGLDNALRARLTALGLPLDGEFYSAEGCGVCGDTGFDGRVGVFEILALDPALRKLIAARESAETLRTAAREAGHRTLGDAALDAARRGEVALVDALALIEGGVDR